MIISLIGYRGTGKSTIGKLLAQNLGVSFCDSDKVIEQESGQSIAQIFESSGEEEFRNIESEVVHQLMKSQVGVIAWGGGVILRDSNRNELQQSDKTVWLTASAPTLFQRIYGDENTARTRPALTDLDPLKEIEVNLKKREALYRVCSDLEFDTEDKSQQDIVNQLTQWLNAT